MKKDLGQVDNENHLTYSTNVEAMVKFFKKFWDIKVRPKGFLKLRRGYSDFDGMEEYDYEPLIKAFKGFNNSTAGSMSFPEQLSVPHVVYNDVCQGRDSLESMIGAIFSYSFQCGAKYQQLKYEKSFKSSIENHKKMVGIIDRTEKNNEAAKSFRGEVLTILDDIKSKLYFDSVVTDHTKLDSIK